MFFFKPIKPSLKSSLNWGATLCFLLSLGVVYAEDFPLLLEGKDKFNFYLIRDENRKPITLRGSPLYEGKSGIFRVTSSLKNLIERQHLKDPENLVPPTQSAWVKDAFQIKVPASSASGLLRYFQEHPKDFENFFSGMTPEKLELFRSLLFDDTLVLSAVDIQSLQRNSLQPSPPPIKIPILIEKGKWGKRLNRYIEMILDIQGDEFVFTIEGKRIDFDPKTSTATLKLIVKKAELKGPLHEVGRLRGFWQFRDELSKIKTNITIPTFVFGTWNIKNLGQPVYFFDKESILVSGIVGRMVLEASLQFIEPSPGLWRIHLAKPLNIKLLDDKPTVQMKVRRLDPDGVYRDLVPDPDPAEITETVRKQIEDTLSDTIKSALNTYFFADDLAFRFPLRGLTFESQDANIQTQTKLSKVEMDSDGLVIGMDARLSMTSPANCSVRAVELIKNFTPVFDPQSEFKMQKSGRWQLNHYENPQNPGWISNDENLKLIDVRLSKDALQLLNIGAYASGLYCLSSRAWWPRPGYIPLLEFRPAALPEIQFSNNSFNAHFEGDVFIYGRNQQTMNEKFDVSNAKNIKLKFDIPGSFSSERSEWKISGIQNLNFSEDQIFSSETNSLNAWIEETFKKDDWGQIRFSLSDLDKLFENKIRFSSFQLTDAGLDISIDPKDFSWVEIRDSNSQVVETSQLKVSPLETEFLSDLPERIDNPLLHLRWRQKYKQTEDVFYSWALRSSDSPVTEWSPFDSEAEWMKFLTKPGKYEFLIKAMNRKYEIEKTPKVYEFYFQPREEAPQKNVKPADWAQPMPVEKKSNVSTKTSVKETESDKGAFGCASGLGEKTEPHFNLWINLGGFLMALASLLILRVRHRRL
ncbi:MAG: hypothetical protein J0L93_07430 [Deltaproteobacteria bacterium]|nr:hypothetical protein [Deltaproteobacteria bacterium]